MGLRFRVSAAACLLSLGLSAGCGSNGNTFVRIINASPDAGTIDDSVAGQNLVKSQIYGTVTNSGNYEQVGAGHGVDIKLSPAGKSGTLATTKADLLQNAYYTIILEGKQGSRNIAVIQDDDSAGAAPNARVRVIHGSPSAGAVDVYLTPVGAPLTPAVAPTIANVSFPAVAAYLNLPGATYELRVTQAGNQSNVLIDSLAVGIQFSPGAIYTIVALDPPSGSTQFGYLLTADPVAANTQTSTSGSTGG